MNIDKLNQWAKEIHDNATAHGWHEEKHSPEHFLSLIMCEVAEAIEADRKDRRVNVDAYLSQFVGNNTWYQKFVKGTVEEEFADIVIRLLDMAYELYGDNFQWETCTTCQYDDIIKCYSFTKNAWFLIAYILESGMRYICTSIEYVYCWAEILSIDLDQHIEWKMQYNKTRPYKHGGKKY